MEGKNIQRIGERRKRLSAKRNRNKTQNKAVGNDLFIDSYGATKLLPLESHDFFQKTGSNSSRPGM